MKSALALLAFAGIGAAQDAVIDVQRSRISVHVAKAGLLSAAGHDHTIEAPISSGAVRESPAPHVEFAVRAAAMTVMPDPKVSAKDQAQIQTDMQQMTLETAKFPEIVFRSSRVDKIAADQWKVEGDLSLHGVTRNIVLNVRRAGAAYTGRSTLKQTDFGIKPISVAGGLIKVKDQLEIDFAIVVRP